MFLWDFEMMRMKKYSKKEYFLEDEIKDKIKE